MFYWFFLCLLSQVKCINRCLDNIEIVEISSTEAQLSWTYSCAKQNLEKYKIHFTHVKFLACPDERKDISRPSGIGTVEVEDTRVIIHNLHAYSEYEFELVAVPTNSEKPEILKVIGETEEGVPEVKALRKFSDDSGYYSSKAVFHWNMPSVSQCELYNSDLGGWVYKVEGLDEWNKEFTEEGILSISQTKLDVDNLSPFSRYMLQLYTANQAGLYDENVVLKIPGNTRDSSPATPTHLQALRYTPGLVILSWRNVFPPTGEVSSYAVRWKEEESTTWMELKDIPKSKTFCKGDPEKKKSDACYVLNNLTESKTYSFQVQSYNSGISQGSGWSGVASQVIHNLSEDGAHTSYVFIVLGCLPIIVILVIILLVKYRKKPRNGSKQQNSVLYISQDPELLTPIFKTSNMCTFPRQSTPASGSPRMFTTLPTHRPRSRCDPLPPVPSQENHIYEAVKNNEDDYLAPNPLRVESMESLDDEGYLRPNFLPAAATSQK